ncbi:MAG: hypothetical protein DRJ01_13120 [Bacteroidetes bacterium]|nr:MAG: hypothetical protein DRJ01_13120 [Bacteroidota bacterium]
MPYRRLPNNDSARYRALEAAQQKVNNTPVKDIALSQKTIQKLKYFLPTYKQANMYVNQSKTNRIQKNKQYLSRQKKVRLYISHFIQVLNLAIIRGELSPLVREFYNLQNFDKKVPPLNTEQDIIHWGEKIIEGEAKRISSGGSPITNPTIALVKVQYENFIHSYNNQNDLQRIYINAQQKISDLREEADNIILNIWNEAEEHFKEMPDDIMREKCIEYGVVYVYRKNETSYFSNVNLDLKA